MAIKDATCPACGKSIKLNDEKPFGFCSFCGHKIDKIGRASCRERVYLQV